MVKQNRFSIHIKYYAAFLIAVVERTMYWINGFKYYFHNLLAVWASGPHYPPYYQWDKPNSKHIQAKTIVLCKHSPPLNYLGLYGVISM